MLHPWHFYLMAVIYIITGTLHFVKPNTYVSIMPLYIPYKKVMVYVSGLAEILLGILLFTNLKNIALWGIIIMLLAFIPVHIYMLQDKKFEKVAPKWMLILRVPLQFALMFWAYWYINT
ncbi:MauE/DoxX family redox-associated membrane protein [Galbibacter sp. PAP.153]|uniref:DoxX family protein n=1 Tax=Galbibacter sp. PAP.153 TaxID=3104623 RepID=UPI0030087255